MDDSRNVQDPEQHAQAFLNSFCQDIESPLNVILTGTELLAEAGRRSPGCYTPQQERAIQSIQDSAAVLGRMAENILDAYQCRAGGMATRRQALELVSHFSQLADLVRPCAARQGVELSFQAQAETLVVMTDRVLADRVVLNLLSNAVYHGGARGHHRLCRGPRHRADHPQKAARGVPKGGVPAGARLCGHHRPPHPAAGDHCQAFKAP